MSDQPCQRCGIRPSGWAQPWTLTAAERASGWAFYNITQTWDERRCPSCRPGAARA